MGGIRPDPTGATVYLYIRDHADERGIAYVGAPSVAHYLDLPRGTVAKAIIRLKERGLIQMQGYGKYAVTELWESSNAR